MFPLFIPWTLKDLQAILVSKWKQIEPRKNEFQQKEVQLKYINFEGTWGAVADLIISIFCKILYFVNSGYLL